MTQFQPKDPRSQRHGAKITSPSAWAGASPGAGRCSANASVTPSHFSSMSHETKDEAENAGAALTPAQALSVFGHYAESDAEAPAKEAVAPTPFFTPPLGTREVVLVGRYGLFKVTYGLTRVPDEELGGKYSMRIEMTPNQGVGRSSIGFIQVFRAGKSEGGWATQKGGILSASEAERTTKNGYAVDRGDAQRDKTPFYGMVKLPTGGLRQRYPIRIGRFGGPSAVLQDTPDVGDPYKIEFSATAIDMNSGTRFGSVAWGFEFNSARKLFAEETPRLVEDGGERAQGRDEAVEKWNQVVAGKDGIEKIPGVWH